MGNITINDVLQGQPLTWETVHRLQRDKRMGVNSNGCVDSGKRDPGFADAVESAARELIRREKDKTREIAFENSEVMQRREGETLSVEFLRKKMKDVRYSGEPWERDADYIKAIEDGFRELFPEDTGESDRQEKASTPSLLSGHER
jgi:hypothetical protein